MGKAITGNVRSNSYALAA